MAACSMRCGITGSSGFHDCLCRLEILDAYCELKDGHYKVEAERSGLLKQETTSAKPSG